ncbi:flippase [Pontibacter diazotrophicus]|uniref:Flippase n=1 Tax=Pontibacter diazotrophicus TaxID=1400979 RepID=A0A3D8LGC7_9BACT|nr:flippase [Pontibacter diazotrophicus]RDV16448.1 flippase [Pontibacter diazotrophicus]
MKKIKQRLSNISNFVDDEYRPLLANFLSLGIIQGSNFLLSIITFPYVVRVIGVESFGLITLLQTIMLYFVVLTDYGFNLTATKEVSVHRNDVDRLSKIFSEVMVTKAVLLVLSFILFASALLLIPNFEDYQLIALLSFSIVVGQLLQPQWLFQGVEQMKYMTYINITIRALYAIGIFTFISQAQDYLYINLINGISLIIGGVISLIIVFKKFNLKFTIPGINQIIQQLKDSWSIFFSTISVSIANNTNIVILGLFASPLVIGYYSIAEKVFQIMRTFAVILYQVVYPRICMLAERSFSELAIFLKLIFKAILLTFLPLSVLVFILSDYIVYLVAGEYLSEASLVLRIICFGPLMAALNIPPAQTMLAYRLTKSFTIIVSIGAAVNVGLNFILAYYFKATGTAFSILATETLITILLYITLYRNFPEYCFFHKDVAAKKIPQADLIK